MRAGMRKKDVAEVFRRRKTFATPHFLMHWRPNALGRPRVAFAFSRGVGNAVARNRFKRRWREIVRAHLKDVAIDIVIVARGPLKNVTREIWQKEVARIIRFAEESRKQSRSRSS